MGKKYLYMQNGSDKFKSLPPVYGKIPLRYRDRHHIIGDKVYDCTGNDLLNNIDPLKDNSLVAKFRLDGNFTNIAPGSNNLTLQPVDSSRVYFEKSGPFDSKGLNFYPFDTVTTNNNLVISNYIANTVFKDGFTISMFVKLNNQNALYGNGYPDWTCLFRVTTDISGDNFSVDNTVRMPSIYFKNSNGNLILVDRSVVYNILNNQASLTYLNENKVEIANYDDRWLHLVYTSDSYSEKIFLDGELVSEIVSSRGEFKVPMGYLTLGAISHSNNITYKQVELFNKKINNEEANILLNQKDKIFTLDEGVVYYEENDKLLYLNTDIDGNILSKGFENKIGYNGPTTNLLSVDCNNRIVDSYGNNPFAGKINRVIQNTSTTLATVTGAGWVEFNGFELDMDTDNYDYIIALTNNVRVYGVALNTVDKGAQVNISINGNSLVTNAPLCYNNASNLTPVASNNSFANVTTITPKITIGYTGKFRISANIAKYALPAGVNDTTWGVNSSTYSNDANYGQNRQFTNDKSDFIIYEIHKDNNRRI